MAGVNKIVIVVLLLLCCSTRLQAETLYISVAASMTDSFQEMIAAFQRQETGVTIRANFASSGALAKQISQGAPADLYVSANPKWMDYLLEIRKVSADSVQILAYNQLVLVGRPDREISQLAQLAGFERIALGSPQMAPAGQYAKQALDAVGLYDSLYGQHKLILAKDVRQALLYADRGEVNAAFVYRTDALLARQAKILYAVPLSLYSRIAYPMGLTTAGVKKAKARQFLRFVGGEQGRKILAKYGFEPAIMEHKQ